MLLYQHRHLNWKNVLINAIVMLKNGRMLNVKKPTHSNAIVYLLEMCSMEKIRF
ncbi:BnaCnng26930D [Brassica napus]|uniref:BnaCnng26930D protein n=1 Tax=Brassica napus TaxID=3708 RepID=A0A078ITB8_BRANA|nr:BnaCnng26930D [Brassica napus]